MKPLETYLQKLRAIRSSGAAVKETSYYPPLASLLSEIGKKLKPKVKCIIHLQDTGAGLPDGGLFTEDQIQSAVTDLAVGAIPARGAIEAKPTAADAWKVAETKQVREYWRRYRQVLVTNYRDFLLVGADPDGNCAVLETYRLASSEHEFWRKAAHPRSLAEQHAEGFEEFLKRAMLYPAPLATPRIPLPTSKETLLASANLGRRIVELLDPESAIKGITTSQIRAELRAIGSIRGRSGQLDPEGGDLDVIVGWGHAGKGGITMPARGKFVERPYDPQERTAIEQGCKALGLTADEATALLGDTTLDVYLNEKAFWRNVPVRVWEYTIGGYQVIKKWLSYREKKLLGRWLTVEETRYVTEMVRRIAALLLLTPELNANYEAVKRAPWTWSSDTHLSRQAVGGSPGTPPSRGVES